MASPKHRLVQLAATSGLELSLGFDDSISQAAVSTALVSVFRGKFCDALLSNRKPTSFQKHDVLYDVGANDRTFFFLLSGFVKVGTITPDGHELIYDVRKGGDVVGELCASQLERRDRAVALDWPRTLDSAPDRWWTFQRISRRKKSRRWWGLAEKGFQRPSIFCAVVAWCAIRTTAT